MSDARGSLYDRAAVLTAEPFKILDWGSETVKALAEVTCLAQGLLIELDLPCFMDHGHGHDAYKTLALLKEKFK